MNLRLDLVVVPALLLSLSGCMVQSKKGAKGDDVAISTPLGGMTVKTDPASVQDKIGLPLYPGAVPEKKNDHDNGSADVDMNFGAFHLRVLAMGFTSADSPEKVSAFYRKALSQYSDVIECQGHQAVGQPAKTGLGLTCADDNHVSTHVVDSGKVRVIGNETELKAGSASRQHIVSYKAEGGGTHFGLIRLELPHGDGNGA